MCAVAVFSEEDARVRAYRRVSAVLHVCVPPGRFGPLVYPGAASENADAHASPERLLRDDTGAVYTQGPPGAVLANSRPTAVAAVVPPFAMSARARAGAPSALGPFWSKTKRSCEVVRKKKTEDLRRPHLHKMCFPLLRRDVPLMK